jgi:hypothetical protein
MRLPWIPLEGEKNSGARSTDASNRSSAIIPRGHTKNGLHFLHSHALPQLVDTILGNVVLRRQPRDRAKSNASQAEKKPEPEHQAAFSHQGILPD